MNRVRRKLNHLMTLNSKHRTKELKLKTKDIDT